MPAMTVRTISSSESSRLAGVLARAFQRDPMGMHLFPNSERRLSSMERMFEAFLQGIYLPERECYTVGDFRGAALWLPPGKYPTPVWPQLRMLPTFVRLFGLAGTPRVFRDISRMEAMHPKSEPHWYLAFLGVEPAEQGRGFGSALLRPMLDRCDADGTPAWLETSNVKNLPLYERHGFTVVDQCDIPGGPHFWGMWREPAVRSEP